MDKAYLKEILLAVKAELIRFRFRFVISFILLSFVLLGVGIVLPKSYVTNTTLFSDVTVIIDSGKKNNDSQKVDRIEQARQVIFTRAILGAVGKENGLITKDMKPEDEDAAIKRIRTHLTVKAEKTSNYFQVSYDDSDPDRSFDMLNSIVNQFITYTEKKKREESSGAYTFIDAQVQSYKKQLEQAEEKLKEFNSKNVDGNGATVTARINQLRADTEALKITLDESQSRVNSLRQQLGSEGKYQVAKGQVDDMKVRRQNLSKALDQLLLSYQENYPDVIAVRGQLAELDAAIKKKELGGEVFSNSEKIDNPLYEELRKQLSVAEVDLRAQQRRMESFIALQAEENERAERVAANQAQLSELTRDYEVIRKTYEDMLQKKEAARLSMTLDSEGQGVSYRIQEPAIFPLKPSGLSFIHFAILGPVVGCIVPLALLLAFVFVDPHIRSSRVLQQQLPKGIELLGVIPHYNTPLGERLLKKDMIIIWVVLALSLIAYIGCAAYWQLFKA